MYYAILGIYSIFEALLTIIYRHEMAPFLVQQRGAEPDHLKEAALSIGFVDLGASPNL